MIDILKRMNENNESLEDLQPGDEDANDDDFDSDDNDEVDLEERIKNLDLNDADALWNVLTDDERNEFEALLSKGDVGSIMLQWEPWWVGNKEKKLVKDMDECKDELSRCPAIIEVPKLNTLTNIKPSPAIIFNITNVLSSYVFVIRYFNGEIEPVEGVLCLLNICANLDTNANFDDFATAVESVGQKCLQSELIQTDEISLNVMKHDTHLILKGPSDDNKKYYCQAALSHLSKIFSDAKKAEKLNKKVSDKGKDVNRFSKKFPEHTQSHLPKLDVSKVKKLLKKVEYYLSYIESYGMNME
ncbi:hypothetical protein O3G_MSEX006226 [Manduca sexta]|uniref:Zinc finger HIT domain-containing protein 2 n=1 Tax=Manduca sexta TaxID=7130 RepID=A0A922CLH3_MANSE|nr:hypothetical protein O3G_MSEX006226 [Manduca sexta]